MMCLVNFPISRWLKGLNKRQRKGRCSIRSGNRPRLRHDVLGIALLSRCGTRPYENRNIRRPRTRGAKNELVQPKTKAIDDGRRLGAS